MGTMASQNNSLTIHYLTVYSGADQTKYQSSASPAFVRGIHPWPVNSPHKGSATRKCFHLMMLSWLIHRRFVLHGRRFTTFDAIPQSVSVIYLLKHVIAGKSSSSILQCHETSAGELIMCNETHLPTSLADINMALSWHQKHTCALLAYVWIDVPNISNTVHPSYHGNISVRYYGQTHRSPSD